ncbi:MAG TPA: peptidylprolyl isomerase [Vicinamibacterales bacterium]|nr:peptidylprolyl isomerase [Vicinamibacterales bacterium]
MAHPRAGDTVRVHYTGRLDDGRVFDSSREREPLELTLGEGSVIPGFEEAITQMEPGDVRTVRIPAEKAYGEHRAELVLSVDRAELPSGIQPRVGQHLQLRHDDGEVTIARIADVTAEHVTIDANHPLAGHDLTFELELVAVGRDGG